MTSFVGLTRPGQQNGTGAVDAMHVEEIWGEVYNTIARESLLAPRVKVKPLRGTSVATNHASGQAVVGRVSVGQPVAPTSAVKFGKVRLTVDTTIYVRSNFPLLEDLQTSYDARSEVGKEHGTELAKQYDETFMIQATKAGLSTANRFGLDANAGHTGATQVTMAGANDFQDPALVYDKIVDLVTGMRKKDVDPVSAGGILLVDHDLFATLAMSELLINSEFKTSEGHTIGTTRLKTYGIEVMPSNNFVAGKNITGHLLSNADNGNAYDGDFTKVLATLFSPKALMAAETIPLTTRLVWDEVDLNWMLTNYRAFGVSPSQVAHSGVLLKP